MKPARGAVVNIIRINAIAIFEVGAAAELVGEDVVDVVLGGGFVALHVDQLPPIVLIVIYYLPIRVINAANSVPTIVLPARRI